MRLTKAKTIARILRNEEDKKPRAPINDKRSNRAEIYEKTAIHWRRGLRVQDIVCSQTFERPIPLGNVKFYLYAAAQLI